MGGEGSSQPLGWRPGLGPEALVRPIQFPDLQGQGLRVSPFPSLGFSSYFQFSETGKVSSLLSTHGEEGRDLVTGNKRTHVGEKISRLRKAIWTP